MRTNTFMNSLLGAVLLAAPLHAATVTVGIGESGTQIEAGAANPSKDGLDAESGQLWGVSNVANRDGILYFTYSTLAGSDLPSTIQAGTYTFSARIGASNVGDGFSGLNDITAGSNSDLGSVAGFFSTLNTDAEAAKNNMVAEFNTQPGVFYVQPTEADPAALSFTTWTFTWTVLEGSPVIGTAPYFGVFTKTGASGGNGFWDDSTLSYSAATASESVRMISVNFHVSNDADAQADHELTGTESAGVGSYASTNWNNIGVGNAGVSSGTLFSPSALADDSGDASAASIAPSVSSSRFVGYCASSATEANELGLAGNDDDLFNSYLALGSSDVAVLQVSGISSNFTANGYRVVIYSDTDKRNSGDTRTSNFELTPGGGSAVTALTEDDGVTFDGTYVLSDNANMGTDYSNYTVFEGLTSDSFTLDISSPDGGRGGINGLQIITGGGNLYADLSSDESSILMGDGVTLSWQVLYADSISIDQGVGDVTSLTTNGTGQITVYPTETTTYTLSASNMTTEVLQDSVTVTVIAPPPVINHFSADTHLVETNGTLVTLSWDVSDADTVSIVPDLGRVPSVGQTSLVVNAATTYTLTASNANATVAADWLFYLPSTKPNILIVLVDDFGPMDTSVPFLYDSYDDSGVPVITAFNHFYHTPNMETLASRGMKFTQAYAQPVCSPTRTSLMTGYNSPRHGIDVHLNLARTIDNNSFAVSTERGANNWRYKGMETTDVTLPKLLGASGYRTIHCGKAHFGSDVIGTGDPRGIGFDINVAGSERGQPSRYTGDFGNNLPGMDEYENSGLFLTAALTQAMNSKIEQAVADGVPFFGYMAYYAVHSPFTTNPDATQSYTGSASANHTKFATMVEGVDISIGDILAKLTELGVAEDTLIFFMGDNGSDSPALTDEGYSATAFRDYPIRGKKASTYEGGARIPLIVSWASNNANNVYQQSLPIMGGSVEHDIVGVEDIMPSILAVTDVTPPDMDGYDLSPYLRSESGSHRPQKMLRLMGHEHRSDYFLWYREADWKILYRFHTEAFELYNLADDPDESDDQASAQPERVLKMARAMARELDASWGIYGELWPTHNPTQVKVPARPLEDDPFWIRFDVDGRAAIDSDGDGLTDAEEDPDADGLVDPGETDPDVSDTDGDGSDDYTELRLNLDPRNPDEAFLAEITPLAGTSFSLQWPSAPDTGFNILSNSNLVDGTWQVAVSNVTAHAVSNETSQVVEESGQDANFFRVELQP